MTKECEIVYYLDNHDLAIIEVEQGSSNGLRNILWFVYHKTTQTISRFSFRPKNGARGRKIKKGFLRLTQNPGKYSIEIDTQLLDFTEQHPHNVPVGAKQNIEKYLLNAVV
ncbi:hypothetical protein GR160_01690 [Flavobacterium sp. Sd200]|uniref:hypothetical protein n=1 Tax=Flavobacterium sp. Sd200 TaxID=2692211 RepID=UPI00136D6525|nr:hypothetical protein [Flavobacterium sp. Sd200]MXN89926.1 hypothetical protein [Flavobacterium sp. Sd200]